MTFRIRNRLDRAHEVTGRRELLVAAARAAALVSIARLSMSTRICSLGSTEDRKPASRQQGSLVRTKRTLSSGDKCALVLAARGDCYYPDCTETLMAERNGHPVANFQIAHIRNEPPPANQASDIGRPPPIRTVVDGRPKYLTISVAPAMVSRFRDREIAVQRAAADELKLALGPLSEELKATVAASSSTKVKDCCDCVDHCVSAACTPATRLDELSVVQQRSLWSLNNLTSPEHLLFRTRNNTRPSASNRARAWHRALDFVGQKPLRVYDCRHAAATTWLRAGMPLGETARRLGHSVETLVSTYVGALDDEEQVGNQRIDSILR